MKKIVLMANDYVGLMITKDLVSKENETVCELTKNFK